MFGHFSYLPSLAFSRISPKHAYRRQYASRPNPYTILFPHRNAPVLLWAAVISFTPFFLTPVFLACFLDFLVIVFLRGRSLLSLVLSPEPCKHFVAWHLSTPGHRWAGQHPESISPCPGQNHLFVLLPLSLFGSPTKGGVAKKMHHNEAYYSARSPRFILVRRLLLRASKRPS